LGTSGDSLESPGGFNLGGRKDMNLKIYVGNLPFSASEEDLKKFFSEAGAVQSVKIITDAYSGKPRGFGFVEMASETDAQKAISLLNGKTLMDRTLVVSEAKPQKKGESSFKGRRDRDR
jgi:RNA recognition motif-containing protein